MSNDVCNNSSSVSKSNINNDDSNISSSSSDISISNNHSDESLSSSISSDLSTSSNITDVSRVCSTSDDSSRITSSLPELISITPFSFLIGKKGIYFPDFLKSSFLYLEEHEEIKKEYKRISALEEKLQLEYYLNLALGTYILIQTHYFCSNEESSSYYLEEENDILTTFNFLCTKHIQPLWKDSISVLDWITQTIALQNVLETSPELEWTSEDVITLEVINKFLNGKQTGFQEQSCKEILIFMNSAFSLKKKLDLSLQVFSVLFTKSNTSNPPSSFATDSQFLQASKSFNIAFSTLKKHLINPLKHATTVLNQKMMNLKEEDEDTKELEKVMEKLNKATKE